MKVGEKCVVLEIIEFCFKFDGVNFSVCVFELKKLILMVNFKIIIILVDGKIRVEVEKKVGLLIVKGFVEVSVGVFYFIIKVKIVIFES